MRTDTHTHTHSSKQLPVYRPATDFTLKSNFSARWQVIDQDKTKQSIDQ